MSDPVAALVHDVMGDHLRAHPELGRRYFHDSATRLRLDAAEATLVAVAHALRRNGFDAWLAATVIRAALADLVAADAAQADDIGFAAQSLAVLRHGPTPTPLAITQTGRNQVVTPANAQRAQPQR